MLGAFECGVDDLLRWIPTGGDGIPGQPGDEPAAGTPARDDRPVGPVRRDPATGDILPEGDR